MFESRTTHCWIQYPNSDSHVHSVAPVRDDTDNDSILGDIITHERSLQRSPPKEAEDLLAKVKECRILARRIKEITINLPSRFVLEDVAPSSMYVILLDEN
jgi:hypothetical protein